jgi:hypothetical protein
VKTVGYHTCIRLAVLFVSWTFLCFPSWAKEQTVSLPVIKGGDPVEPVKTREFNSIRIENMNYRIAKKKKINAKMIEAFYNGEFTKQDFKRIKCESSRMGRSDFTSLTYMGGKKLAEVLIENKDGSLDLLVHVSVMDKEIYYNKKMIDVRTGKDNPGFDFPDVPRGQDFIRIFSVRTTGDNNIHVEQVTYKFKSPIPSLVKFFKDAMPKKGWKEKNMLYDQKNVVLMYSMKKRHCEIMIMHNPVMRQNTAVIQVRTVE